MKNKFILIVLMLMFISGVGLANPQATSDTGSKILTLNLAAYPEGFELIYGKRPFGPATRELTEAKLRWDQYLSHYRGLTKGDIKPEVLAEYQEWGMGNPVFYLTDNEGVQVAFPEAKRPINGVSAEYINFPAPVIATYQIKSIDQGVFFIRVHPFVPPQYTLKNMANGQKEFESK